MQNDVRQGLAASDVEYSYASAVFGGRDLAYNIQRHVSLILLTPDIAHTAFQVAPIGKRQV